MRRLAHLIAAATLCLTAAGCSGGVEGEAVDVVLDIASSAPATPQTIEVPVGSEVTLHGTSEVDDHLHVHGYEEEVELVRGEEYEVVFTADMSGVYEIETHDPAAVHAHLEVR